MDRRKFLISGGAAAGMVAVSPYPRRGTQPRLTITDLKVEYIREPMGLENVRPRLSWRLESCERNVRQQAFRILVASDESLLDDGRCDVWDSGKIASRNTHGVRYTGRLLQSRQRYWWRVQVWSNSHRACAWSSTSWWEMGLLAPEDWTAQWLAVEDSVSKGDREKGLHWIWGAPTPNKARRKFRANVELKTAALRGYLLVGAGSRRIAVWIDNNRQATDDPPRYSNGVLPITEISIGPLERGNHLFSIEVQPPPTEEAFVEPGAMTAFIRLHLADGQTLRMVAGPNWRTSLTEEADWFSDSYNDAGWEHARALPTNSNRPWPPAPAMHLRKDFSVEKTPFRARLYATALGSYEIILNRKRVGQAFLTPESTLFSKRVLYRVYDVLALLEQGPNTFCLTVGDGWYASSVLGAGRYAWAAPPRRVLAQLEITFSDGSKQVIATGPGWRIANSAIVSSEIYDGEIYDARGEHSGWDTPGFNDVSWKTAEMGETPRCRLECHICAPIRATQFLNPQAVTSPKPGVYVFDFGQNFAGWCRLRTKGPAGTRVVMRFAEVLLASGEIDQSNLRGAKQRDVFILRGNAKGETFEPRFTYHGFRYVEVSGLPEPPTIASVEGVVVHSALDITGDFRSENALIERIWRNSVWSQRSNFMGIPTDCPQRDERLGYLADAGIFWDAAAFNMDVAAFTRLQMKNASDCQHVNGAFPPYAPIPESGEDPIPGWADGAVILPWTVWRRYGDLDVVDENWNSINRYLEFILKNNIDHVWRNKRNDAGDWLSVDERHFLDPTTSNELIGTAYWAHSTMLFAQMTEALGRRDDATTLFATHDRIRQAFIKTFVSPDGRIGNESQTSYVLALQFGLVPTEVRRKAAGRLAADIRRRGGALSTGYLGTPLVLDVLANTGHARLAYDLLLRTAFPSWGHMIEAGATTMWESWNGKVWTGRKEEQMPNSYNHYALGSVCGFLFRRVAGIDAGAPGFESIIVRPIPDQRVMWSGAEYDSMMGRISTLWRQTKNQGFHLDVTIPANASAHVYLPARPNGRVEEGGADIASRDDLRILNRKGGEVIVEIGSGSYSFFSQ